MPEILTCSTSILPAALSSFSITTPARLATPSIWERSLPATELIFRLDNTTQDYSFFTGPGSRNPDGEVHAGVDFSSPYAPQTYVGFEDRIDGDFDYNDTNYSFTNLRDTTIVPEPGAVAFGVLAAGSVLGLVARKRKKA